MKKITVFTLFIVISLWTVAYAIADPGIDLDPKIEKHLQQIYDTKDLSKKFALSVEELDLSNLNLTSAKGLEHFKNLKVLNLSHNVLTDVSFLKELEHLTELNLSFNQIEDLKLNSPNLEKLDLEGNRIETIDFVANLQDLTYLNLRANRVTDLTPVEGLDQLQYLNVRGNKVEELEPLRHLMQLTDLNIRNNRIRSIEPLLSLPLNERLVLSGNDLDDLNLLENKMKTIPETDFEIKPAKPKFTVKGGIYEEAFQLEIEAEEGLDVYYTLDGSIPDANSEKYDGPIEISKDVMYEIPVISNHQTSPEHEGFDFSPEEVKYGITVTAVTGYRQLIPEAPTYSEPVTETYILEPELQTRSNLPIVSLRMDPRDLFDHHEGIYVPGAAYEEGRAWTGNYSLRGREYEKEGSFELFHPDESLNFKQNVGFRINGRGSRRFPQKSLRIYPRSDYGQSRFYTTIFEDLPYDEFNLLLLRNSGQDVNSTLMRDGLMHELIKDLPVDVQAYQPVIVLMNGEYWGIHNLREKYTDDYIDIKYNVKNDDLILMKAFLDEDEQVDFDIKSGTKYDQAHYDDLINYSANNDLSDEKHLKYIEERVDLDNFFHFVAYQVYFVNTDSFSNNLMVWRKNTELTPDAPYGHDGRWRFMLFDLDWGMGFHIHNSLDYEGDPVNFNMLDHVTKDEHRMTLFRELMKSEKARDQFTTILLRLLNNHFEPERVKAKVDEIAQTIQDEIPYSITRWENIPSVEQWKENVQVLKDFADKRPEIIKEHLQTVFGYSTEDLAKIEKNLQ